MEVLIAAVAGVAMWCLFMWWHNRRKPEPPRRQQWASRSPEKLSPAEQQFCTLVARGVSPADALDGIVRERGVNTHARAAMWMKKPKIQAEIARLEELQPTPHDLMPDDTPTADLTEEVGARIKPAEPWEGL